MTENLENIGDKGDREEERKKGEKARDQGKEWEKPEVINVKVPPNGGDFLS